MTAAVEGVIDYDVFTDVPEEDEYTVARALADFIPEEEGRFIALELNAPVFVFTKHASGWWTGECKGKYGLFPSNFVTEEFHVALRPKLEGVDSTKSLLTVDSENSMPVIPGGTDSELTGTDDTDSDEDDEGEDSEEGDEMVNLHGSTPIAIPNSAHATPEKQLPKLTLPSTDSFLLTDSSKLTPVSRQLGEFVDRLNESARTPPVSGPSTPTHSTPQNSAAQYRKSMSAMRDTRTDSLGELMYDPESNKLTPVSRQLGEFVERLNQNRASTDLTNHNASLSKIRSTRSGEPIFNVFDGLLADIESLRNPREGDEEWADDVSEEVYNTPEAARARIAIDVKALRDELEQEHKARKSVESEMGRLREEFAAQLAVERKGRIILEKRLSEREARYHWEIVRPLDPVQLQQLARVSKESKSTETDPEVNPLQKELDEEKAKNRAMEKELEKLHQTMFNLHKEGEDSGKRTLGERNEVSQELEYQRNMNKQLEAELKRMADEISKLRKQNIQAPVDLGLSEEVKMLREELTQLRAQKEEAEKRNVEQINLAKEQVAKQKDEEFLVEREHIIQQRNELMKVELQKLSEREEERAKAALDGRSKQLDAVIAAHEETRKQLESERDQAREGEATKAKELEELKVSIQKQKSLPPKPSEPKAKEMKVAEPKAAALRLAQSHPIPASPPEENSSPLGSSTPSSNSTAPSSTAPTLIVPDDTVLVNEPQRIATAPRLGHSTPTLQSDQPKQAVMSRRGSHQDTSSESLSSIPETAPSKATNLQRAQSHDTVHSSGPHANLAVRPPAQPPTLAPRPANAQEGTSVSPNLPRDPATEAQDGPRKLAVAAPARRTIANRPSEDHSLENSALFQSRRLSTQNFDTPAQNTQSQPQPQSQAQSQSQQPPQPAQASTAYNPVLKRAASSLPSVPTMKDQGQ